VEDYIEGDLDPLYDPLGDFNDAIYLAKHTKHKDTKTQVSCSYCFRPISYNYSATKAGFYCRETVNTEVVESEVSFVSESDAWYRELKPHDPTIQNLPDVIFKVSCLGCDNMIGELHSSKKMYFLFCNYVNEC